MNEYILKKALQSKNTPNILLFGYPFVGKKHKLFSLLDEIYPVQNTKTIIDRDIQYIQNSIYYVFTMNSITIKNSNVFFEIIDKIIHTKNYFSNMQNKIIVLTNFTELKRNIQNVLRVKIEKYRLTTVFILITTKYNNVLSAIRSRCLCIRVPAPSRKEKRQIIHSNIRYSEIGPHLYDRLYEINEINTLQKSSEKKELYFQNYQRPYHKIMKEIFNLYSNKYTPKKLDKLRELSYAIIKFKLLDNEFYYIFLSYLLKNERIRDKNKIKLIQILAQSQYNLVKSYRSILTLESLLIQVYIILSGGQ